MNTKCPKCDHEFDNANAARSLTVKSHNDEFRALLSDAAKKVYDVQLKGTVVEVINCTTCKVSMLKPEELSSVTVPLQETIETHWPAHADHAICLRVELVQFFAAPITLPLMQVLNVPNPGAHIDLAFNRRLRTMAHVFNKGVDEGWIAYGVLAGAHSLPLAFIDAMERKLLLCYPGTFLPPSETMHRLPHEVLNAKIGFPLFSQEGELGNETAWEEYAQANGII